MYQSSSALVGPHRMVGLDDIEHLNGLLDIDKAMDST